MSGRGQGAPPTTTITDGALSAVHDYFADNNYVISDDDRDTLAAIMTPVMNVFFTESDGNSSSLQDDLEAALASEYDGQGGPSAADVAQFVVDHLTNAGHL